MITTFIALVVGLAFISIPVRAMLRHRDAWPREPRSHHIGCPICHCSYEAQAGLTRHYMAQHTDGAVFRLPIDGGPQRSA